MLVDSGLKLKRQVAEKLVSMGLIFEKNGNLGEAISCYQQAILEQPSWSELYYHLGLVQYKQGNLVEAISCYQQGIALGASYPNQSSIFPKIHYNLGVALQENGDFEEAIKSYQQAILVNPQDSHSYNNLGCLLIQQGKFEEAVNVFENAIIKANKDGIIYINLGQAFLSLEKPEKAVVFFRQAIALEPDKATGYYHLGYALQRLGKYRQALIYFEQALTFNSNSRLALYHKIYNLIESGYIKEAIASLKPLVTNDNPWINHYCKQAKKLTDKDEWKKAKKSCGNFLEAFINQENLTTIMDYFAQTHIYLGNVMVEYGEPQKGESHYHKALLVHPSSSLIYLRLGYCLSQQGRENAARIVYQMAGLNSATDLSNVSVNFNQFKDFKDKVTENKICDGLNCSPCLDQIIKSFNPKYLGLEIYQLNFDKTNIKNSPEQSIHVLNNGRVWVAPQKNEWMICNAIAVWNEQDQFLPKLSRNYPGQLPNCKNYHPHKFLKIEELPPSQFVEGTVAVLSGLSGHIYFHWMVDILPRLDILVNQGYNIPEIDWFLINSYRQPFQKETLVKLGIPLEKIIESDRYPHIQAKKLIIPSFSDALGWLSSQGLAFHRHHFLPKVKSQISSWPSRIYISRSQASYRQVLNEQEIINYLKKYDFLSINLESLTIEEQISLFANAQIIIAPHGSGLTNLMFCQPGTTVIELLSPHYIRHYYWVISQQLGLHHYYIKGEVFDCYPIRQLMYPNPLTEDILISKTSLEKMMNIVHITQPKTMVSFSPAKINQFPHTLSVPQNNQSQVNQRFELMVDSSSVAPSQNSQVNSLLQNSEDLEVYLQGAEALYRQGQYEQVAQACKKAISLRPDARIYKLLGNVRQSQGQGEEAKRWYAKAIQIQPNFAEAFTNLGTVYAQQKQWQEAITCYQKAIALQPKLGVAYRNLARAWTQLGQMSEATECWYHAYAIDPELVSAEEHLDLATKLMEMGLVTQAVSSYCRAIEADPNSQQAYRHLGAAMKLQKQLDSDALDYQQNLTLRATGSIHSNSLKRPKKSATRGINTPKKSGFLTAFKNLFSGFKRKSPLKSANPNYLKQPEYLSVDLSSEPSLKQPYQGLSDIWIGDEPRPITAFASSDYLGVEDYLKQAELAAKLGNLSEAIAKCQKALELQPNLAEAYKILGQVEQAQIHRESAQSFYEQAIYLGLQDGEVYLNLGSLYAYQQEWQPAIESYHKALDLNPKSPLAYWNLAKVWRRLGKTVEMADCLYEAYCLEPNKVTASAHLQLGNTLLKHGQKSQAIACYQRAIKMDSNLKEAHEQLAKTQQLVQDLQVSNSQEDLTKSDAVLTVPLVEENKNQLITKVKDIKDELKQAESYLMAKEFGQAIAICKQALIIHPDNAQVYKIWGNALQGSGKIQEAREKYNQAIVLQPDFAEVYANLGSLYGREKDFDKAISCYQRAIAIKPDLAAAHRNLARIWKQLSKVEEWAKSWNQALALEPEGGSVKEDIDLGHALVKHGDLAEAIICYQRAIKVEPSSIELYDYLGELLISEKRWQEAINVYRKGVENYPDRAEFYGKLGQALSELHRYEDAILVYGKAVKLNQNLSWVYHDIADILVEQGKSKEAIAYYQKTVKLEPNNWEAYHSLGEIYQQQGMLNESVNAYQQATMLTEKFCNQNGLLA